jgi:hypothetical protein
MLRNALLIAAGSAIAAIVVSGLSEVPYPTKGVALLCGAVAVEVAVLLVVLRPGTYGRSWRRALAGAGVCLASLWVSSRDSLGAPEYVFMHQKWLVAAAGALLALAIASLVTPSRK